MIKHYFFFCLLSLIASGAGAQTTPVSGMINRYSVPLSYDACSGTLTVTDTAGFSPFSRMLVVHIQGAQANVTNSAQFGVVTDIRNTGYAELAEITARTGNTLTIRNRLQYALLPDEVVQLVTYPEFDQVVVTDTIKPLPWDGQKGGVVAFKTNGTLTLNAPVIADGMGFRGGIAYLAPNNNCTWLLGESGYVYGLGNWRGGTKGEGIVVAQSGQELGRGALANGGGGGNDHNSGGGGGSNTSAGGLGGKNDEPSTFGCDGAFPGLGGKPLTNTTSRVFMGGGGGAGHTNNTFTSDGGNGGGMIFIEADQITGTNPKISANGENAVLSDGDGGGGGGAGGSIWLYTNMLSPGTIIRANGGNGGNTNGGNSNRCFGPGGGGSGGRIFTNATGGNLLVSGGVAGIVTASTNGCNGSTNGGMPGQNGVVSPLFLLPEGTIPVQPPVFATQPLSATVCEGEAGGFICVTEPAGDQLQWQVDTGAGWQDIPGETGNVLLLPGVDFIQNGTRYRCVLDGDGCYFFISDTAILTVTPLPVADFLATDAGNGVFAFLNQSQNTIGKIWDFGDGTTSLDDNPEHLFPGDGMYVVQLTVWNDCDTVVQVQEVTVNLPPVAAFMVADTIAACGTVNVQFVNTSVNAASYQWSFSGGNPAFSTLENPTVSYTASGFYQASLVVVNGSGSANTSSFFYVESLQFPVADFTAVDLVGGNAVQFTYTGSGALYFTWDFGDGSPVSNEPNPAHEYAFAGAFTVRLTVQNQCGASVLEVPVVVINENSAVGEANSSDRYYLKVWPNPAKDYMMIQAETDGENLVLFDVAGKQIFEIPYTSGLPVKLSLERIPEGCYWVKSGRLVQEFCIVR